MKNKKIIIIAVMTIAIAIMLTGCGNNDVKTYDKEQININVLENNNISNNSNELNQVVEENKIIDNTASKNQTVNSNESKKENKIIDNNDSKNQKVNSNESSGKGKVVSMQLQSGILNYDEYAILHAYDKNGNEVWKYTTGSYPMTELARIQLLDYEGDSYAYLVEGGTIIKFNKQTGDVIWKNSDFDGGSVTYAFDDQDNLYIAGYNGPGLFVVNKDGKTIKRFEDFPDEGFYWPSEMWFDFGDRKLMIQYEGNPKNTESEDLAYRVVVEVNISDYSYKLEYEAFKIEYVGQ